MTRRTLHAIGVLLPLLAAHVACAQEPRRSAATAAEAFRSGQYDDALRMARADAAREPRNAAPVRLQGAVLRATGRYADAEDVMLAGGRRKTDPDLYQYRHVHLSAGDVCHSR